MQHHFDAIVLGVGGVGSAALHHLAQRGCRVLGIDRFAPGHARGSSHGQTRAIRQAYFEHPNYVPLLLRAYELWRELEQQSDAQLLFTPGLLEIGAADGQLISGIRHSAELHQLNVEEISRNDITARFPGFHLPDGNIALLEPEGGYLLVEQCVRAHAEMAQRNGAVLDIGAAVLDWSSHGNTCTVTTEQQQYTADRLVITAGAWAGELLRDLGVNFAVVRKHLHWYRVAPHHYSLANQSPVWFYQTPGGCYYGFPQVEAGSIKVCEHSFDTEQFGPSDTIDNPLQLPTDVDPHEQERVAQFLKHHLPHASQDATGHSVCMYTLSPDEHFVVDRHPDFENVVFAAGLSGHGFKFASVLGELVADLTLGSTEPSAALAASEFLSLARLAH